MNIFNIFFTFLVFVSQSSFSRYFDKDDYMDNPDFSGIWIENNYSNNIILKIQKENIPDSKYNHVIKKRVKNLGSGKKYYRVEYVGSLVGKSLSVISRCGKKKKFYISKTGVLTDLDQYYMIRSLQ